MKRKLLSILLSTALIVPSFLSNVTTVAAEETVTKSQTEDTNAETPVEILENYGHKQDEEPIVSEIDYSVYANQSDMLTNTYGASVSDTYFKNSKVTPVRNQNPYGLCWSFAATACIEADLVKNEGVKNPDYSELAMAYFVYNPTSDPLKQTPTEVTGHNYFSNLGGNQDMCVSALASGMVTTKESNAPYSSISRTKIVSTKYAYTGEIYLNNALTFPVSDRKQIKQAVLTYGAAVLSFCYSDSFMNTKTGAFYNPYEYYPNHDVAIVGWDDNYATSNFKSGYKPSKKGAWIIKNSWGTEFGKSGYMYISYYDKSLYGNVYAYDVEKGKVSDNTYQYDFSYSGSNSIPGYSSMANIFEVSANDTEFGYETLDHVAFQTPDANVDAEIKIYTDLTDGGMDDLENAVLADTITKSFNSAGYYTLKTHSNIVLKEGSRFAVVVSLTGRDGKEKSITCNSDGKRGNSYAYRVFGEHWEGWFPSNGFYIPRIKAFTKNRTSATPIDRVKLNAKKLTLKTGATKQLTATVTGSEEVLGYELRYSSSNETVATVDENGFVTTLESGSAYIYATLYQFNEETQAYDIDSGLSAKCAISVEDSPVTKVTLNKTNITIKQGQSVKLRATLTGGNSESSIAWCDSNLFFGAYITPDSDDPRYCTIYGKSAGSETIWAYVDGKYAKCNVTVIDEYDTQVVQSSAGTNSVKLTWTKPSGANITGYYVLRKSSPSSSKLVLVKTITSAKTLSYTVNKLSAGKTYYFVVYPRVKGNYYKSGTFDARCVTTTSKVTGVKTSSATKSSLKVSWKKVTGAGGYYVYASTSKKGTYKRVGTVANTASSFTYKGLAKNKTYYFKVYSYRSNGTKAFASSASSIVSGKTKK